MLAVMEARKQRRAKVYDCSKTSDSDGQMGCGGVLLLCSTRAASRSSLDSSLPARACDERPSSAAYFAAAPLLVLAAPLAQRLWSAGRAVQCIAAWNSTGAAN